MRLFGLRNKRRRYARGILIVLSPFFLSSITRCSIAVLLRFIAPFDRFCQISYWFTPIVPFSRPTTLNFRALVRFAAFARANIVYWFAPTV